MSLTATLAALNLGGQVFGTAAQLMRPKPKFPKLPTGRLRSLASARMATRNAATQANIKQVGAAGRLPSGAITSSLAAAGAGGQVIDPNLDLAESKIQQFNVGQETQQSLAGQQRYDDIINTNLSGFGALSKIAILAKMGLLNPLDQEEALQ